MTHSLRTNNREVVAFLKKIIAASEQELAGFAKRVATADSRYSALSGAQNAFMSQASLEVLGPVLAACEKATDTPDFDAAQLVEARLTRLIVMSCGDSSSSTNPFSNLMKQYMQSSAASAMSRLKIEGLLKT